MIRFRFWLFTRHTHFPDVGCAIAVGALFEIGVAVTGRKAIALIR